MALSLRRMSSDLSVTDATAYFSATGLTLRGFTSETVIRTSGRSCAAIARMPSRGRATNLQTGRLSTQKWVPHGFVCVRVDSRGAGRSPGRVDHFSPRETDDFCECIEWAGTQSWSNGKVGLSGISYYAMNQWQVAARRPPHLAAMCPWEGASDWYRDATHHGGMLSTFWEHWSVYQAQPVEYGLGTDGPTSRASGMLVCGEETLSDDERAERRGNLGEEIRLHPVWDKYYEDRTARLRDITIPLLSCGNWGGGGLHLRGNTEGFVCASSTQKWLELHGGDHWTRYYSDYGVELQRRFFAYFLQDEQNGWDAEPPVQIHIRHSDGSFTQRSENDWPIARTRWTRLYLDAGAESLSAHQALGERHVEYDALGDGVTFRTEAMEAELEVTGPVAARLFASSTTEDADLFLVLRVFDTDGREVTFQGSLDPRSPVAQGWLRASHRKLDPGRTKEFRPFHAHDEPELLTPGHVYELDIEIWPTSIVIPPGHTLALTIRGSDYNHGLKPAQLGWCTMTGVGPFQHDDPLDRPAEIFSGTVTLHTGPRHAAFLVLPVIPTELKEVKSYRS